MRNSCDADFLYEILGAKTKVFPRYVVNLYFV